MKVDDLAEKCLQATRDGQLVQLVVRKRRQPKGQRMRLAGPGSPLGRYVSWLDTDRYLGEWDPAELMVWLHFASPVESPAQTPESSE